MLYINKFWDVLISLIFGTWVVLFLTQSATAQTTFAPDWPVPIEITARSQPTALCHDGGWVIIYELSIFNPIHYPLNVTKMDIHVSGGNKTFHYSGADLRDVIYRFPITEPDTPETINDPVTLQPGEKALVYIWVPVKAGESLPENLSHVFEFSRDMEDETIYLTKAGPTLAVIKNELVIAAPVRGGKWLVGNGFSNNADHRRFVTIFDKLVIPQRFGADFLKLGTDGNNALSQWETLEDFYSYNEPLYAVADGTVVRVLKGLPDRIPGQPHPIPITWSNLGGNSVVVQIGPEVYSLFAHLKPGSIKVEVGQKVKKGTVIGLIGNSGNSLVPHLHFQLMDGEEPSGSEGVPFVFEGFCEEVRDYTFTEIEALNDEACIAHENSIPGINWVIRFPGGF